MNDPDALASVMIDQAIAAQMMPWSCPCEFGPEGRYVLLEVIGASGRSLVFRAKDTRLSDSGFNAQVAVKIYRDKNTDASEALSARRVSHPNVLRVLDRGTDPGGNPFIVLEFEIEGDLTRRPGPWKPRDAAHFVAALARAVAAAHREGVVHCDLKPANVLVTRNGEPKLADFDLAHSRANSDTSSRGNFAFMSPEQFQGLENALTPPSDVYALGGILYFLLTQRLPNGDSREQVAASHRASLPLPPSGVDRDLDLICSRAMSRARDDRYPTALALAEDLDRWLHNLPLDWSEPGALRRLTLWVRRRPLLAALTIAALGALIGGLMIAWSLVIKVQAAESAIAAAKQFANERIAEAQSKSQDTIRQINDSVKTFSPEEILPWLVYLEWLGGNPVLTGEGQFPVLEMRIKSLAEALSLAERQGRADHTDVKLCRLSLAYSQALDGRLSDAANLIDTVDHDWKDAQPHDPVSMLIRAIRTVIKAESGTTYQTTNERTAEILHCEDDLTGVPQSQPATFLLQQSRRRILSSDRGLKQTSPQSP